MSESQSRLRAEPIGGSRRRAARPDGEQQDPADTEGAAGPDPEDGGDAPDEPDTGEAEEQPGEDAEGDDEPAIFLAGAGSENGSGHGATTAARRGRSCLAVVVALAVLIAGGLLVWNRAAGLFDQLTATPDYSNPKGAAAVTVTVPKGSAVRDIGDRLHQAHVVKSAKAFNQAVRDHSGTVTVQAGSYRMRTKVPAKKALHRLLRPTTYRIHSTARIKEGLTLSQQVSSLAKQSKISKKSYRKALSRPKTLDLPTWSKDRPEGFLFPNSYELTKKSTATSVLQQMTGEFTDVAAGLNLSGRAHKLHKSRYEILIVASLVEAEVKNPADRPKVARVIYNRLAKKQRLQLDSTVHYASGKTNKVTTTAHQRASKSPYNTYRHKGLPPRPIGSPGKASLKAAAHPAHGKWLYFVTVNPESGKTAFTHSAKKHHKNVKLFHKWCKKHKGHC